MYKYIMQSLGLSSKCCNEKIVAWSTSKYYCDGCHKTIGHSPEIAFKDIKTMPILKLRPKQS